MRPLPQFQTKTTATDLQKMLNFVLLDNNFPGCFYRERSSKFQQFANANFADSDGHNILRILVPLPNFLFITSEPKV